MSFKKRFIALFLVLALMAAGAVVYIAVSGGAVTDVIVNISVGYDEKTNIRTELDKEGVLEVENAYLTGDGHPCLELRALSEGNVTVTFFTGDKINNKMYYHVNRFGTIINRQSLNFDGFFFVQILILAALALIVFTCAWTLVECFIKSRFSYFMVACGGIALFCSGIIALTVYYMQWMNTFRAFLNNILSTGEVFAYVAAPVMMIIALAISISNIWLLRKEGFRPQNMLGIALGVVWIAALWLLNMLSYAAYEWQNEAIQRVRIGICYILSFMTCMLLSTIVCAYLSAKRKPDFGKDYLVILGCCIRQDGTLTPILRGRVDAAIEFEKEQFAATGKHAKFVPSGGQGPDEVISESEAMRRYLLEQGYPDEQIIKEDKSVNTDQNIRFSCQKIHEDNDSPDTVQAGVATTNYHIFRSYVLSKKHGLRSQGISAKTKWYFYPNAFLREFVGLLNDKKIVIALILIAMILLYNLAFDALNGSVNLI